MITIIGSILREKKLLEKGICIAGDSDFFCHHSDRRNVYVSLQGGMNGGINKSLGKILYSKFLNEQLLHVISE